ncbi:hypothetical protein QTP88_010264 [Uroleucon formosanum]
MSKLSERASSGSNWRSLHHSDEFHLLHCVSANLKLNRGIALEFRRRFGLLHNLKLQYLKKTEVAYFQLGSRYIINPVTKNTFLQKPTLEEMYISLRNLRLFCQEFEIENLAMPKIGCGLDQLDWWYKSTYQKKIVVRGRRSFKKCVELSLAMEAANNDVGQVGSISYINQVSKAVQVQAEKDENIGTNTVEVNFVKPYTVDIMVNEKNIDFQIDTGSGISAISFNDFKYLKTAEIRDINNSDVSLKAYNNSVIIPLGYFIVNVKVKNCCKKLKLYVIENGGLPIIGRDWLGEFDIFSSKFDINSSKCEDISQLFPSVFKDSLGCFKLKQFELYLKDDFVPIFCKPRVLPFALKDKVSEEFDKLVKEDILVAVETSE